MAALDIYHPSRTILGSSAKEEQGPNQVKRNYSYLLTPSTPLAPLLKSKFLFFTRASTDSTDNGVAVCIALLHIVWSYVIYLSNSKFYRVTSDDRLQPSDFLMLNAPYC